MDEIKRGKHARYKIPVYFWCEKLDQKIRKITVGNNSKFHEFLSYLYCFYRRIEMSMEKIGHQYVFPDLDFEGQLSINIFNSLENLRSQYKTMDKNNFLNMYPIVKKLFICYIFYIKYSIGMENNIYEGNNLPGTVDEIKSWLQKLNTWTPEENDTEWVASIKCKAIINYNQVEKRDLRQILESRKNIEEGRYPDIDAPISLYYQKEIAKSRKIKFSNNKEFIDFISYLYFVYRKIETKMKNNGYERIPPDSESDEKSFARICVQLVNAKEAFESVDKNSFLNMYPLIKRLFFSYRDYIDFSIKLESHIDEGDFLPGKVEELKSYLTQLDAWFPVKINEEWKDCIG